LWSITVLMELVSQRKWSDIASDANLMFCTLSSPWQTSITRNSNVSLKEDLKGGSATSLEWANEHGEKHTLPLLTRHSFLPGSSCSTSIPSIRDHSCSSSSLVLQARWAFNFSYNMRVPFIAPFLSVFLPSSLAQSMVETPLTAGFMIVLDIWSISTSELTRIEKEKNAESLISSQRLFNISVFNSTTKVESMEVSKSVEGGFWRGRKKSNDRRSNLTSPPTSPLVTSSPKFFLSRRSRLSPLPIWRLFPSI